MASGRYVIAGFLCLAASSSGCGAALGPPPELLGLWSAGPAACAAGVGLSFDNNAVQARVDDVREPLFEQPIYRRMGVGDAFRVRIDYQLPHAAGPTRVGGRGALVLERGPEGRLRPVSHMMVDPLTGSARIRIKDDPVLSSLDLRPCGAHAWTEDLRGRDHV
jgi:hypothetical protein